MQAQTIPVIEGSFRVLATAPVAPRRPSPNRQRAAARIVFWNLAFVAMVVAMPILF